MRFLIMSCCLALVSIGALTAASGYDSKIILKAFQNGSVLDTSNPVSGVVDVRVRIRNKAGQHAQFYENFRTAADRDHGHVHGMIDSNNWVRWLTIDTTNMYDGENLISVHAHPMNVPGQPFNVSFSVGALKLITDNANPAPNGDELLPLISLPPVEVTHTGAFGAVIQDYDPMVTDDGPGGSGVVGRSLETATPRQMIPHLGSSVLGRFRWPASNKFGDFELINAMVSPFQTDQPQSTHVVFFISDGVGRANYGFAPVTIPSVSEIPLPPEKSFQMPHVQAEITSLHQGDEIIVDPDGTFPVDIHVSNIHAQSVHYGQFLTLWVGNRVVDDLSMSWVDVYADGADEVTVTLEIAGSEILKMEQAREAGYHSAAFAVWVDLGVSRSISMADHIHLDSIRTTEWNSVPVDNPPVAQLDLSTTTAYVGEDIEYDASASSDDYGIKKYIFLFGDGQTERGAADTVSHAYAAPGLYRTRVRVEDTAGQVDKSKVLKINVLDAVSQ